MPLSVRARAGNSGACLTQALAEGRGNMTQMHITIGCRFKAVGYGQAFVLKPSGLCEPFCFRDLSRSCSRSLSEIPEHILVQRVILRPLKLSDLFHHGLSEVG